MLSKEELLKLLNPQIDYLSQSFKIAGMEREDIAQELRISVLLDYSKNSDKADVESQGWWFQRLKWYVMNLREKESKEPINRSVRIENFKQ